MSFNSFVHNGQTFDFAHLNSFSLSVPHRETTYSVLVNFSCHCFTEKFDETSDMPPYTHRNEVRTFNIKRYGLSKSLRSIIEEHANKKVFFTRNSNYLIVSTDNEEKYAIFFDLKRERTGAHHVVLTVASAYLKDALPKHLDKINFRILIAKIATGQQVRSPYHHQR